MPHISVLTEFQFMRDMCTLTLPGSVQNRLNKCSTMELLLSIHWNSKTWAMPCFPVLKQALSDLSLRRIYARYTWPNLCALKSVLFALNFACPLSISPFSPFVNGSFFPSDWVVAPVRTWHICSSWTWRATSWWSYRSFPDKLIRHGLGASDRLR